jgi:predicted double-glycine peptidase
MIYPRLLLKHLKARRASANYPLYDVPNKQEERTLDELRVRENFDYSCGSASID